MRVNNTLYIIYLVLALLIYTAWKDYEHNNASRDKETKLVAEMEVVREQLNDIYNHASECASYMHKMQERGECGRK